MKQRIQSSHIPPCHRHMVIATILSVHCFALLHHNANQTSAECCLEFTARGGYWMFPGLCVSYKGWSPPQKLLAMHLITLIFSVLWDNSNQNGPTICFAFWIGRNPKHQPKATKPRVRSETSASHSRSSSSSQAGWCTQFANDSYILGLIWLLRPLVPVPTTTTTIMYTKEHFFCMGTYVVRFHNIGSWQV